jgi:hypothetical protein
VNHSKWLLVVVLFLSGSLQIVLGVWLLLDIEGILSTFGIPTAEEVLEAPVVVTLQHLFGPALLFISAYSLFTAYLVFRDSPVGYPLAVISGAALFIIGVLFYIRLGNASVLYTDGLRGFIILVAAFYYRYSTGPSSGEG